MLLRPSEYKRSPTHTFIGNFVISCQDFQSYCLISVLLGTTSREKKEADLSQLVLASFLSFQAAQDDSRRVRWDCGAVSAYSGCLCSPTLVRFLSLSSRERATKCFLSHTLRDFNVHLPYVLQSLLLLGKIRALMFFHFKELVCSAETLLFFNYKI